ncbi:hypothetical protein AKJ16_DCAP05339, partial [Drosera capensis]
RNSGNPPSHNYSTKRNLYRISQQEPIYLTPPLSSRPSQSAPLFDPPKSNHDSKDRSVEGARWVVVGRRFSLGIRGIDGKERGKKSRVVILFRLRGVVPVHALGVWFVMLVRASAVIRFVSIRFGDKRVEFGLLLFIQ